MDSIDNCRSLEEITKRRLEAYEVQVANVETTTKVFLLVSTKNQRILSMNCYRTRMMPLRLRSVSSLIPISSFFIITARKTLASKTLSPLQALATAQKRMINLLVNLVLALSRFSQLQILPLFTIGRSILESNT